MRRFLKTLFQKKILDFLKLLGANKVDSMDASSYESATIVHDLNYPISEVLKSKYSVVLDSGTLEHVFNFPVAIKSCMEMLKVGGHYIGITPANNFFGHGFYQFSPELFFRIFDKVNGFKLVKMFFYVDDLNGCDFYEVSDPNEVKSRVTLINSQRSYLFVIAQKLEIADIFMQAPLQSDYEHILWENKSDSKLETEKLSFIQKIKNLIPLDLKIKVMRKIQSYRNKYKVLKPSGISNPMFIKRIDKI